MKKYYKFLVLIMSVVLVSFFWGGANYKSASAEEKPKLAIVIDDFGEDRRGVEEMLNLPCKLNIAVMPGLEFSKEDAEKAHAKGHEVILHMPMENVSVMPESYYGPKVLRNRHSADEAKNVLLDALSSVPYAVGVNNHMGTGVTQNNVVMSAVMEVLKERNMFFLDSKTIMGSVASVAASEVGTKCYERDFFLEPPGYPNYSRACEELLKAAEFAKENGRAVAIGHVGPVGEDKTAKAIADTLQTIYNKGVEVVFLSEL